MVDTLGRFLASTLERFTGEAEEGARADVRLLLEANGLTKWSDVEESFA